MTPAELLALAEKAQGPDDDLEHWDNYIAACSPERIAALCRCVIAADELRLAEYHYDSRAPGPLGRAIAAYDAARAKVEKC